MIIGFTGTLKGTTLPQKNKLHELLQYYVPESVVHGGAWGSDHDFDTTCLMHGIFGDVIHIWPGSEEREKFWREHRQKQGTPLWMEEWQPPLSRNRDIVREATVMLATPKLDHEEIRSGTWATIRHTRHMSKPLHIIWPDGLVTYEDGNSPVSKTKHAGLFF